MRLAVGRVKTDNNHQLGTVGLRRLEKRTEVAPGTRSGTGDWRHEWFIR